MYNNNEVISYLQANKILALKLDQALTGVGKAVSNQIEMIGAGVTRSLYYTSCFTDEYQDVCQRQKAEDIRFSKGVYYILQHKGVIYDMVKIYFEEAFKDKTSKQLEHIKKMLMTMNIHIAASSLTKTGFVLATATSVSIGMNLSFDMSTMAGRAMGIAVTAAGLYGVVQKAADSAERLRASCPPFFSALYARELEMMYFLVEPLFDRAEAFKVQWSTDAGITNIIEKMIRQP